MVASKGKKAEAAAAVPQYEHPEPKTRDDDRKVIATVKLAAPVCSLLEFKLEVTPSTKISFVSDKIIEQHGGSVQGLSVCVNRFHPEEIQPPEKTLEQCGVVGSECIIYYDFLPVA